MNMVVKLNVASPEGGGRPSTGDSWTGKKQIVAQQHCRSWRGRQQGVHFAPRKSGFVAGRARAVRENLPRIGGGAEFRAAQWVTIAPASTRRTGHSTMKLNATALSLAALMCIASIGGYAARPSAKAIDRGNAISLETMVPRAFGEWTELAGKGVQVVNPQTKELLDKLYSQQLTRSYVNKQGYRIMLSMAYGDDQRGGLQAHRPEVCYPAQGFTLGKVEDGLLPTSFGNIEVRRLTTRLASRNEPVTYWLTVGDQVIRTSIERRIAEIRLGLTGQIPDGLLFRISSIDNDEARGFTMQQKFAADLMAAVPAVTRKQLSGLSVTTPAS